MALGIAQLAVCCMRTLELSTFDEDCRDRQLAWCQVGVAPQSIGEGQGIPELPR